MTDASKTKEQLLHELVELRKRVDAFSRMESALEELPANLFQNSAVPTFVIDNGHRVMLWNKACEELTGIKAIDIVGTDEQWKPFYDNKRPVLSDVVIDANIEDMPLLYHTYSKSKFNPEGLHAEGWYPNINGEKRYITFNAAPIKNSKGELIAAIETFEDLTGIKKAEEELLKFSIAIEQSPITIVITDIHGDIEFVNPKFTQMTGYSFEEVQGQNPRILKSGTTKPEEYRKLWATIMSGNVWQGELNNRKKDGELFMEYAKISPIKNKNGVITHFLAIKEDITEKKALEAQLFQAQKMEAIGQLAGGVAHDFNNILTVIIGFSSILKMKMAKDDPLKTNTDRIIAAANRAAELIRSLLAFSRKQVINPQPIDINKIIEKAEIFLQRVIGEDITLSTTIYQEELVINADSGQIEQVLMNMVTNARDAMPDGGVLSIETASVHINNDFIKAHGYGTPGVYALISINDSGMGMDETTRKRLFEPFYTTKEMGKGTGLGLSIVYGIIKQHNGFLNVYSEKGIGTIFKIYLPLIEMALDSHINELEEVLEGGVETVLIADDDESIRDLIGQILSQFGYTVITATGGVDALRKFDEYKDSISLLLMDIIMPNMNGKEVLDEIRKIRPDIKSIFISGYTADIINKKGILDAALDFITKPLMPAELLKKVREVLDRTC